MCELKIPFKMCLIQAKGILIHISQGWTQTVFIFILEMLRIQSSSSIAIHQTNGKGFLWSNTEILPLFPSALTLFSIQVVKSEISISQQAGIESQSLPSRGKLSLMHYINLKSGCVLFVLCRSLPCICALTTTYSWCHGHEDIFFALQYTWYFALAVGCYVKYVLLQSDLFLWLLKSDHRFIYFFLICNVRLAETITFTFNVVALMSLKWCFHMQSDKHFQCSGIIWLPFLSLSYLSLKSVFCNKQIFVASSMWLSCFMRLFGSLDWI